MLFGFWVRARKSKQTAHRSRCVPPSVIPNNPERYNSWWCHYKIKTDLCLCLTKNVTFVSMPNGHLYWSFEDCSTLHSNRTLQCTLLHKQGVRGCENYGQELTGRRVSWQRFPWPAEPGQRLGRRIRGKRWVVNAHDIYSKRNQICCLADQNTNAKMSKGPLKYGSKHWLHQYLSYKHGQWV